MQYRIIALFVIAALMFLLSILLIEISLATHFTRQSSFAEAVVKSRKGELYCLVVGDSHAAAGFRDQVGQCGNLGAGGLGILQVTDIVHSVVQKNDLQFVMMTLGPQQFSAERLGNRSRIFRNISQEWEKGWNPLVVQPLLFDRWISWMLQPMIGFLGLDKKVAPWDKMDLSRKNRILLTRLEKQTPILGMLESDAAVDLLQLIDILVAKNIKVCIVRTPVVQEYEALLNPVVEGNDWQQLVWLLEQKKANVVDYRQLKLSLQPTDFSNEDHLNEIGAAKFAPLIIEMCNQSQFKV